MKAIGERKLPPRPPKCSLYHITCNLKQVILGSRECRLNLLNMSEYGRGSKRKKYCFTTKSRPGDFFRGRCSICENQMTIVCVILITS